MTAEDFQRGPAGLKSRAGTAGVTESSPLLSSGNRDHFDHPLSSSKKTFGNILIAILGAGVLGLPYAFKQSGWVAGVVALTFVALACTYTMNLLIHCKRKLESESTSEITTYSDLGYSTFGRVGRAAVDLMVILSQGGFCVAYLIFIGENLADVFAGSGSSVAPQIGLADSGRASTGNFIDVVGQLAEGQANASTNWGGKEIYIWIIFPLEVVLASIRSLTRLAPFSIFADIANVAAMGVVMSKDISAFRHGSINVQAFTSLQSLTFVIGVAIYAFEGFSLILPLENSMKRRTEFGRVLGCSMASITLLYTIFACLGYFAFGDLTKDIITLNLGYSWQTTTIKLALCVGLFFTYPVMMHPVHEVVERRFCQAGTRFSLFLRSIVVIVTTFVAVSVPHFGDFLSLIGSSVCSVLSFVLPCLFHLKLMSHELTFVEMFLDYGLIAFGIVFGSWGTISSFARIFA